MMSKTGLSVVLVAFLFGCSTSVKIEDTVAVEPAATDGETEKKQVPASDRESAGTSDRSEIAAESATSGSPKTSVSSKTSVNSEASSNSKASGGGETPPSEVPGTSRDAGGDPAAATAAAVPAAEIGVFIDALKAGLQQRGLLSERGRYQLAISLFDVEQPQFGLDMTVTTRIGYILTDSQTGEKVLSETIVTSDTATVGDALAGMTRLRLANEASDRKNIEALLEKLSALKIGAQEVSVAD